MEPERLGKYEVREAIGRGAVGTVHVGWDPVIERRVAVKKLQGLGTDSPDVEKHVRFKQEARAAGRLSHPHIVGTFDYGETADCAYIVMELLAGPSLKEALRQRSMSRADVGRVMGGLLAGLRHSHERGVIHRDIKPGNIVFTEDGEVKITDFGVARLETSDLTQTGSQIGTPAYMAPEQVLGEPADARSDLYAAGVVLFELLTFRRPFEGSTSSVLHHIVSSPPPPASQFAELVSPDMDAILKKALAKSPDERYQTAAEFADALRAALGAPLERQGERAPDEPAPAPAALRRRPLVLAAAAVLLLSGGAALMQQRLTAARQAPPAGSDQVEAASPAAAPEQPDPAPPPGPALSDPQAASAGAPAQRPEALANPADGSSQQAAAGASDPADPAPGPAAPAPLPEPADQAAAEAIAGGINAYSAEGWPVIDGKVVRLAGIAALPASAEKLVTGWTVAHGSLLSCEPARSESYQCLTAQSLDLSQAILLNGLAKATADAAQAYRDAEQQAQSARRGLWK